MMADNPQDAPDKATSNPDGEATQPNHVTVSPKLKKPLTKVASKTRLILKNRKSGTQAQPHRRPVKNPSVNKSVSAIQKRKSSLEPKVPLKSVNGATTSTCSNNPPEVKSKASLQEADFPKVARKKIPDFNKIHQARFKKMDDLNSYIEKKQERSIRLMTPKKSSAQSIESIKRLSTPKRVFKN